MLSNVKLASWNRLFFKSLFIAHSCEKLDKLKTVSASNCDQQNRRTQWFKKILKLQLLIEWSNDVRFKWSFAEMIFEGISTR